MGGMSAHLPLYEGAQRLLRLPSTPEFLPPFAAHKLYDIDTPKPVPAPLEDSNAVLKDVLVVRAQNEQDAATAREVIQALVGDYKETAPA
ncbi:hypothetical protein [Rhodoferax sp.]|uniref:hypothetical protein n=1 Tax=Rhodoferax sp. TaxID=50421 RepID=UPI003C71A567